MSDGEWIPARPHCLPGCDRLDGHDGRDPGACMKDGAELLSTAGSRETCWFWESHHETCRFESLIPGSEPCADCPQGGPANCLHGDFTHIPGECDCTCPDCPAG